MSAKKWLEKAIWTTDLITPATYGGLLSPAQAKKFLQIAIDYSQVLKECRHEFSDANKFQVPRIAFSSRIMVAGVEGERVVTGDRKAPAAGLMELSTVLLKGEVPISDELFEDNIEKDAVADSVMTMVAEAVGRDVEELIIQGDTARDPVGLGEDAYLDLLNGLIKQLQTNLSGVKEVDAGAGGAPTTYDGLFELILEGLDAKYRRDPRSLRLYVPVKHRDKYLASLRARGTSLGDSVLIDGLPTPAWNGIPIRECPMLSGTPAINGGAVDYTKFIFLTAPENIVVGWHRKIKIEKFRDPREGATSILPSCRVDCKFADPDAASYAYDVPTTLI